MKKSSEQENKYIIGSHNTMSYLKAKKWYLRPIAFMGRCQSTTLYTQFFRYGVRYFDLRIKFNNTGLPTFWHGIFEWKFDNGTYNVYNVIRLLNEYSKAVDDKVYVRLLLEEKTPQHDDLFQEMCFKDFCSECRKVYTNLVFVGGKRVYDAKQIYHFKTKEPTLDSKFSSMTHPTGGNPHSFWAKIDDLWPWLYAKLHNKENYETGTTCDVLFLDFINIDAPDSVPEGPQKPKAYYKKKRNFRNLYGLLNR